MWFARFQNLMCELQSIWHKFLALSWGWLFRMCSKLGGKIIVTTADLQKKSWKRCSKQLRNRRVLSGIFLLQSWRKISIFIISLIYRPKGLKDEDIRWIVAVFFNETISTYLKVHAVERFFFKFLVYGSFNAVFREDFRHGNNSSVTSKSPLLPKFENIYI